MPSVPKCTANNAGWNDKAVQEIVRIPKTANNLGVDTQDNPGPSQQNLNSFLKQAKIKRENIIIWNTIPWLTLHNENVSPTKENINKGIAIIKTLMPLLKNISIVILAGAVALQTRKFFVQAYPDVVLLSMPHPSPLSLCRSPSVSEKSKTLFTRHTC
ncbi:TPA: hypothetical protein JZG67_004633 [Escherichia coli]|nr:hypothetical protein [Escherichia coli]HAX5204956.1 hypothetical protein [Escherichia coli]